MSMIHHNRLNITEKNSYYMFDIFDIKDTLGLNFFEGRRSPRWWSKIFKTAKNSL